VVPGLVSLAVLAIDALKGLTGAVPIALESLALGIVVSAAVFPRAVPVAVWLAPLFSLAGSGLFRFVPPLSLDVYSMAAFVALSSVAGIAVAGTLPPGRARRILLRIAASLLLFSGAYAALEAVARSVVPRDPYAIEPIEGSAAGAYATDDPVVGFKPCPGFRGRFVHPEYGGETVTLSAQGFRGDDVPAEKPAGERRVAVLGDSIAFGLGVKDGETIASRLGPLLGPDYRAINASLPGYGTLHELIVFSRDVAPLSPDVVIVAFYAGNDLDDNESRARRLEGAGLLSDWLVLDDEFREANLSGRRGGRSRKEAHEERRTNPLPIRRAYWDRSSALFRTVAGRIDAFLVGRGLAEAPAVYNWQLLQAMEKNLSTAARRDFDLTGVILKALKDRVEASGGQLAVAVLPVKIQCEPEAFESLCTRFRLDPARFDLEQIGRLVVASARERGIAAIDLLPALRAAIAAGEEPFYREGHLRALGHERVAETLASFLRAEGLAAPENGGR